MSSDAMQYALEDAEYLETDLTSQMSVL